MSVLATNSEILQLVTFNLGNEEYAVDILKVQEINRMVEITTIPNAPFYVEGVINLRGKVIPVINLRKRFGLDSKETDSQSRIMVVDVGATIGLIVDSVSEVLRLSSDTIEPPPPMTAGDGSEYIKGVGKLEDRLLILLDIDRIFGHNGMPTDVGKLSSN
ncbi:MAG: chemotaxis protein CheW [Nitrospirota bacterium]